MWSFFAVQFTKPNALLLIALDMAVNEALPPFKQKLTIFCFNIALMTSNVMHQFHS
jgi:hypothetical protein